MREMSRSDIGQIIGVLANVGVLIGIFLLVYELNQNRQMMEAQTRNAISETLINIRLAAASNTDLVEAVGETLEGGMSRERVAQFRTEAYFGAIFRYWENVHYQYRQGLYQESEYLAQREAWRGILSIEPIRDLWCSRLDIQSQDLVAEIDGLLETPCE